jgi:hypothetical protein
MRVEMEKIRRFEWSPFPIVQVQTPVGRTAVPWCGPPDAALGRYDVEWTITTEIRWVSTRNKDVQLHPFDL